MADIHKKYLFHIGSWLGFFLIIIFSADELDSIFLLKSLSNFLPAFVLFYCLILWAFPSYLGKHLNVRIIIITATLAVCTIFLRPLFTYVFAPDLHFPFDRITFWVQFRYNILFVGIAFAFHYASEIIKSENQRAILEKENSEAKLALLRNQLNPHFLYNSLSLLFAKTLPLSEEVASLVGKISDILRYSLDEPLDKNGMVSMSKEIEHIENYIAIQSQRFSNNLQIKFEIFGEVESKNIIPMLLVTFVENAFKHGDLKAEIYFGLNLENNIEFWSKNTIVNKHIAKRNGIGLENVKKRLEIIYPEKHSLTINNDGNSFSTHLKIWD